VTPRSARIEQFNVDEQAPEGALCALLCEDHHGTYMIPFQCRRSDGVRQNARTDQEIDADVIGWREWNIQG
jgi:hypothetical protein